MRRLLLVAAAAVLAGGLLTGCKKGDDEGVGGTVRNPFVGTWQVGYGTSGVTMTVSETEWSIPGIGSGTYTYSGDWPDYVVTFVFGGESFAMNVRFTDGGTARLCYEGECFTAVKT